MLRNRELFAAAKRVVERGRGGGMGGGGGGRHGKTLFDAIRFGYYYFSYFG